MADYDKPYMPIHTSVTKAENRTAEAAEFSAHHIGRISAALERIAAALEKKGGSA
jgi:hypothetical protein